MYPQHSIKNTSGVVKFFKPINFVQLVASLLLVVMPGATSSVFAPSSDALCYLRSVQGSGHLRVSEMASGCRNSASLMPIAASMIVPKLL